MKRKQKRKSGFNISGFERNISRTAKQMSRPGVFEKHYKSHPMVHPFKDKDRDKVKNIWDCQPLNRKKQDWAWDAPIGMFQASRPRCKSCVHATKMCALGCYNKNVENYAGPNLKKKDIKNEQDWKNWTGKQWREDLEKKAFLKTGKPVTRKIPSYNPKIHGPVSHQTQKIDRLRLMERGEAFRDPTDIKRVQNILEEFPKSKVWIPTRAWRDKPLRRRIEDEIMGSYPNQRIAASLDPSNIDEPDKLEGIRGNWRTMYFGSDKVLKNPLGEDMVKCPKTWEHKYGACQECDTGCFRKDEVHVHLKAHGPRGKLPPEARTYVEEHERRLEKEHPEMIRSRAKEIEDSIDNMKDDP